MNRKQRRALAKQNRSRQKKMRRVEDKMGMDFNAVKDLASRLERVQTKVNTMQQAMAEIPKEELNTAKLAADMEEMEVELQAVRKSGKTLGPAVQKALEEAIEQTREVVASLNEVVADDAE